MSANRLSALGRTVYGAIYRVVNPLNGRIYIGLTRSRTLRERFLRHVASARSLCRRGKRLSLFHQALLQCGEATFRYEQIDWAFSREELLAKESYWISFHSSDREAMGYNSTSGGQLSSWSAAKREAMSQRVKAAFASGKRQARPITLNRRVRCTETGAVFMSARKAAQAHDRNEDAIARAARVGGTSAGYHWEYIDPPTVASNHRERCCRGLLPPNAQSVRCVETNEVFPSISAAALHFGFKPMTLQQAVRHRRTYRGVTMEPTPLSV